MTMIGAENFFSSGQTLFLEVLSPLTTKLQLSVKIGVTVYSIRFVDLIFAFNVASSRDLSPEYPGFRMFGIFFFQMQYFPVKYSFLNRIGCFQFSGILGGLRCWLNLPLICHDHEFDILFFSFFFKRWLRQDCEVVEPWAQVPTEDLLWPWLWSSGCQRILWQLPAPLWRNGQDSHCLGCQLR